MSTIDPLAFRSDKLPTAHFDARFSDDSLQFWVPILIDAAQITEGIAVLDVGCGTGGFSREIACSAGARVTGLDVSERFIDFAVRRRPAESDALRWLVGTAEKLPFEAGTFDRVLLSLVLHQLARPADALSEAFRVLREAGLVLVRTIAPEHVADRVPERYIPAMAEADAARLPRLDALEQMLERACFTDIATECHVRNKSLALEEEERALRTEVESRYSFVTVTELEEALRRMREDAAAMGSNWIDPRPTYVVVASKPRR